MCQYTPNHFYTSTSEVPHQNADDKYARVIGRQDSDFPRETSREKSMIILTIKYYVWKHWHVIYEAVYGQATIQLNFAPQGYTSITKEVTHNVCGKRH